MEAAESGVEVNKVHILYFLCRKGLIEDPQGHLIIRVHNLTSGIRLQDVKRWLAELRGKDMPDSFAWSYKRKLMKGFVWQDLADDELITPDPNNEYVLKGSEISPVTSTQDTKQTQRQSTSEIEEVLPESTLPVDFKKVKEEKRSDTIEQEINKPGESYLSLYLTNIFHKKAKKMTPSAVTVGNSKPFSTPTYNSSSQKTKSHANVKMIRNLITCRTTETNDSIFVPSVDQSEKFPLKNCSNEAKNRIQNGARKRGLKFKATNLQNHIQWCKGMKAISKGPYPATLATNNTTAESIYGQSVYAYLMTH